MKAIPTLLILLCIVGCSVQKRFTSKVEQADRLVVLYPSDGLSIIIIGEELKNVIRAIATAKKEKAELDCTPYLRFEFYRGDQRLESISTCNEVFWIDRNPYSDRTKTLEAITIKYREAHPPMLKP